MQKRPRASVTDICNERLEYFQSKYENGKLRICDKVKDAQATFSDKSTDFDSVAKLLNSSDEDLRRDAATMLLEISKLHFRDSRYTTFLASRNAYSAFPAPLTVDRETSVRVATVLEDLKREKGVSELFEILTLQGLLPNAKCVELAIPRLNSSISDIQLMAVKTIHRYCEKPDDEVLIKVLSLLNRSTNESVQIAIIDMLKSLKIDLAPIHLKELMAFARDGENSKCRIAAIELISRFGVDSLDEIPSLVELSIRSSSQEVAAAAIKSIVSLAPHGEAIFTKVNRQDCIELSKALLSIGVDGRSLRRSLMEHVKKGETADSVPVKGVSIADLFRAQGMDVYDEETKEAIRSFQGRSKCHRTARPFGKCGKESLYKCADILLDYANYSSLSKNGKSQLKRKLLKYEREPNARTNRAD
jgi:hypothetical protein